MKLYREMGFNNPDLYILEPRGDGSVCWDRIKYNPDLYILEPRGDGSVSWDRIK